MAISAIDAAKIVLGLSLNHHATIKERSQGLFPLPPQNNFNEAVKLLREKRKRPQAADAVFDAAGLSIVPAAIRLVEIWDSSGEDWLGE